MTVLSECGIDHSTVAGLLAKGLSIPPSMVPVEKPLESDAPDWWVYAVDDFTPPLTEEERAKYIEQPRELGRDLLENLALFSELCHHLLIALHKVGEFDSLWRRTSAHLAILRLFQSAMDYHYYRYDRHFDYQDHEESPVGYHWLRLKNLCIKAVRRSGEQDVDGAAHTLALSYLSSFKEELPASTIYLQIGQQFAQRFRARFGDTLLGMTPLELQSRLRDEPAALEEVSVAANRFRQTDVEILENVLKIALLDHPALMRRRNMSDKSADLSRKAEQVLSPRERRELHSSVAAMIDYQLAQEEEPFHFYGIIAQGSGRILDVGFQAWQALADEATTNGELILVPHYQSDADEVFGGNPIFGTRKLLHVGEAYFAQDVLAPFREELLRWTSGGNQVAHG